MVFTAAYISHSMHSGHMPFRTLILYDYEHEILLLIFTYFFSAHLFFFCLYLSPYFQLVSIRSNEKSKGLCVYVTLCLMCSSSEQLIAQSLIFNFYVSLLTS